MDSPNILTNIAVSNFFKRGNTSLLKFSTPLLARPIELITPQGVSVILGVGLPSRGFNEIPL
ncbi:hypothetical protein ES703_118709 [subsurface metagenome]